MQDALKVSFAAAAAALFVAGCGKSAEPAAAASAVTTIPESSAATALADAKVKCFGINECKGQSQCGVPGANSCAGQNECKGKGWLQISTEECTTQGGRVL
jgi:hypothetical protein